MTQRDEVFPIWSPDGSHIVFSSNRKGRVHDLYQKQATGAGSEELLLSTPQTKHAGRFLLYRSQDSKTGYDIWALPLDGDRKPFPVVQTDFQLPVDRCGAGEREGRRADIIAQIIPIPGRLSTLDDAPRSG